MAFSTVYAYPVAGTVPPTVAQVKNMLTCQVGYLDADTTGLITHNWRLSTTQLARLWPNIFFYISGAGTASPLLSFALTNSVLVTITKVSAAGSGGTITVTLLRPHSIIT